MLLDKLETEESRIWYAYKTIENGWSGNMLELQGRPYGAFGKKHK